MHQTFVEHNIATLWSECDFDCVGEFVDACFECATCFVAKFQLLCHVCSFLVLNGLLANNGKNVAACENKKVIATIGDFGAAVLAVQDNVTNFD